MLMQCIAHLRDEAEQKRVITSKVGAYFTVIDSRKRKSTSRPTVNQFLLNARIRTVHT